MEALTWLASMYQPTFLKHIKQFGEPSDEDWKRYRALFADK